MDDLIRADGGVFATEQAELHALLLGLLLLLLVFGLGEQLVLLQLRDGGVARVQHDVAGEVQHLLQRPGADVQQRADAAGDALEVPDVGYGRGQLDVAHALTAHLGLGDLDAALVANDALEAGALVLAAVALPVLGGPEDALAEQAVALRLQRAIVDGFRLGDLAVGPFEDFLRRRQADLYGIKIRQFKQGALSFLSVSKGTGNREQGTGMACISVHFQFLIPHS